VTYLAVAGQGSGSISVYQLTAMGGLTRTDHVLDDTAQTRFAGITQLETISAGGRSYLVAAGNDQGISLLEMLPGGRLLHLASFADTAATALDSVSALALHAEGDVVQIFATSASDGRVSQFRYDPGDLGVTEIGSSSSERLTGGDDADILAGGGGNDTLSGGAGDDVLMDGAGEDQMTGGAGADIFVISADGVRDTIIDFDVTQDRIDLSAYEMLYDVSQLDIQTTSYGARLTWRGEELRVFDPNRDPLSAADFSNATLFNLNRPPIGSFTARAMLEGDNAANRLEGPAPNLEISGLDGDDVLISQGGDNLLVGGGGVDLADYGGVTLVVSVDLQAGLAVIGSEGWQDQLIEIENLRGGTLGDVLAGDVGDNTLWGEEGADSLLGGFGSDELVGGTGADTLRGEDGADTLFGNTSTDLLYGQGGDDELRGESGNDELRGSSGADSLLGGAGDDELHGGTGVDTLRGDSGNDTLYGNQGADPLYGDDGNDTLRGGTGDDSLAGGAGNDTIYGNQGVDTLVGGAGDDFLRGGTRADTFVYASGSDQIDDFDAGEDRLQLDAALWSGSLSAAEVLDQFGSQVGGDYVLDFGGGDTLTFNGGISESALEAVLTFI
jgi:Ca2+-binding RTX toxin-like protein